MTTPIFNAGGLASGLDTNSIVSGLVQASSAPLMNLRAQQSALQTKVSAVGDLASRLSSLNTAVQDLKTTNLLSVSASSAAAGFTAEAGSGASTGNHTIQVLSLAQAATARSQAFDGASDKVAGGTLHLAVQGSAFDIAIDDGSSLSSVADAINSSGADVTASVISDGIHSYLSVSNQTTGYPVGQAPSSALSMSMDVTGSDGQTLALSTAVPAKNAQISIDGLPVDRSSNVISDVVPGVTLSLRNLTSSPETLQLSNDVQGTASNLQKFVDAYNSLMSAVQSQLSVSSSTDASQSLSGDPAVSSLNQQLQSVLSQTVGGSASVRTLADLGVKAAKDGSLTLDQTVLSRAIQSDPGAVNHLFSQAGSGIADVMDAVNTEFTDPVSGAFTTDTQNMNNSLNEMKQEASDLQSQLDAYKSSLLAQFTAMEQVVSSLKNTGNYLTALSNQSSGSNK